MRDAINLTKSGHPVVLFVNDPFELAARAQAKGLGATDLNIQVVKQYRPGNADVVEEEKAVKATAEFPGLLLAPDAPRS